MKRINNLFIIGNPTQFIFLIEAQKHYNIIDIQVFISSLNIDYLLKIKEYCDKNNFNSYSFPQSFVRLWTLSKITRIIAKLFIELQIIILIKKLDVINLFVVNIFEPKMKLLVKKIRKKYVVVLDDGNATITTFNRINSNPQEIEEFNISSKKIEFFTIYNDIRCNVKIVPNTLTYYKSLVQNKIVDEDVLFILGSPFVKLKMASFEEYFQEIQEILLKNLHKKVYYIKHRVEDRFNMDGVSIMDLNEPIELFLLKSNFLPYKIINFYSSASIMLIKIFENKIFIENLSFKPVKQEIVDYYKRYSSDNFLVY